MATLVKSMLGINTKLDTSGSVYLDSYANHATNDVWPINIIVFADSGTRIGVYGLFRVPKNFVGSPKILVDWTSAATSGDVEWDFDYRCVGGNDAESLDQTGNQESLNVGGTAPSAAHERLTAELSPTAGNFAADDLCLFSLWRDGTDAGDTMADEALLLNLYFEYSDV